jgi:hypothetical protein
MWGENMRNRIGGCAALFAVALGVWAGTCLGEWEYEYDDNFSTAQLTADSLDHSMLWQEGVYPPDRPYLALAPSSQQSPRLGFWGFRGAAAHLNYCFPLGSSYHPRQIKGELGFDVLPADPATMPDPSGWLSVSVSGDGQIWTAPVNLDVGHHTIRIASAEGTCFVAFAGNFGFLADLKIEMESEVSAIHVPSDYATIQRAIDAASPGQEVVVAPGTYWGDGNWNLELWGKAITVRSDKGPEQTILDCQGPYQGPGMLSNRAFYIHQGEGAGTVIQGFTIQNGNIPGNAGLRDTASFAPGPANPVGGAIYCENAGPTIVDCVIQASGAEFGGGIGCVNGTPEIVNCRISGCKAGGLGNAKSGGFGGAIALLRRSDAAIRKCVIGGNRVYYNGFGGGLYIRASTAQIAGCQILSGDSDGNLTGGGIAIGGPYSKVTAEHCVIASNAAQIGGGIWIDGRHDNFTGGLTGPICEVGVANCTVADNVLTNAMPPYPAGGIYASKADIRVRNCIVYGNGGQELQIVDPAINTPVTYCDIKGGYAGAGNINVPPLFAPTGTGQPLDYHLLSMVGRFNPATGQWVIDAKHSPCIDAGDLRDAYDLEPEPNGHRINQGAYGDTVQAGKGLGNLVYHVDGTAGNDKNDGLSHETAFKTIPKGINTSRGGDTVLVWPGVYTGPINFYGKAITLTSAADAAVLTAPGDYAVSFYSGEGPESVLNNFVIRGCLGGIFVTNSSPTLTNLTLVQNTDGVLAYEDSQPSIRNCIMWANSGQDLFDCKAFYSCIEDEGEIVSGSGNIRQDPLFADPQRGDFHLKSRRGRFVPGSGGDGISSGMWILDEVSSPCIDAGDPEVRPVRERMPNGGRLNQGASGGTPFASMSDWPLSHDSTRDGRVDLADFVGFAEAWLQQLPWVDPTVSIRIVKSGTGDVVSLGQGRFDITAEVVATGATIVRVEFYIDGILTCVDYTGSSGWICNTQFKSIGVHRICARAINAAGGMYEAECVEMRAVE